MEKGRLAPGKAGSGLENVNGTNTGNANDRAAAIRDDKPDSGGGVGTLSNESTSRDNALPPSGFSSIEEEARFKKAIKERRTMSLSSLSENDIRGNHKLRDILLNLREAAEFIGLTIHAMRKRVQRGKVKAHWYDGKWYVWRSALIMPVRQAIRKSI